MQNTLWLSNIILFFPAFFENMLIHPDENVCALGFSSLNSINSSVTVSSLIKGTPHFCCKQREITWEAFFFNILFGDTSLATEWVFLLFQD